MELQNKFDDFFNKESIPYLLEVIFKNIRTTTMGKKPSNMSQKEMLKDLILSEDGESPLEVAEYLIEQIYTRRVDTGDGNYFCFMQNEVSIYSLIGDFINNYYNPYAASVDLSEGTVAVENELLDYFAELVGYDKEVYGGQYVSGASMGNLSALIVARDVNLRLNELDKGTIYLSDQAHSSLIKASHIIGVSCGNVRIIESDETFQMDIGMLEDLIKDDLEKGYKPFCIVGTLGTTNTGAVDNFLEIASISKKYNTWFHVDAAYGGSILLSSFKVIAKGVEYSDSITWDAHKWLFQTYGCSIMLCKDRKNLLKTFTTKPEYLKGVESNYDKINFWDLGIEMTRPARGMKLWYTLKVIGLKKIRSMIDNTLIIGDKLADLIREFKNIEIISYPHLGIMNVRYYDIGLDESQLNKINTYVSEKSVEEGTTIFLTTELKGITTLRFNFKNPKTDIDVFSTIFDKIEQWGGEYSGFIENCKVVEILKEKAI